MSLKRIRRILENMGLSPAESKVYIYIAKKGPTTANMIGHELNMSKQQLSPILNSLKKKGVIVSSSEHFVVFLASSFDEVLDKFISENVSAAEEVINERQEIISSWREMTS